MFIYSGISVFFYDWFKQVEEEKVHTIKLVAGGDIMLSRGIWWRNKRYWYNRTFSWDNYNPLSQYDCYQSGDCLLVFNLESMFSKKDNDEPYWWFSFRSNTWNIQYLLELKKDNNLVLSLANNHTNNAWGNGIKLTREILSWENIWYFWAWATTWEAEEIYTIEQNWIMLCFQSFSYDGNHNNYWWEYLAWNPLKQELIEKSIGEMENIWCNVKVLMPHWWAEYRLHPEQWQRDLAYFMIDKGADIILWGHSHVPWSYEEYKGKPIFYSFWNFIFDQDWGKTPSWWWFDYIYDFELKRRTVPTYVPLLVGLEITKNSTWILIGVPEFKMARINKWIYEKIDLETFNWIMSELAF